MSIAANPFPHFFRGCRFLVYSDREMSVRRSWRERLFTAPWRPTQKFRTVTLPPFVDEGYPMNRWGTVHIHYKDWEKLLNGEQVPNIRRKSCDE